MYFSLELLHNIIAEVAKHSIVWQSYFFFGSALENKLNTSSPQCYTKVLKILVC